MSEEEKLKEAVLALRWVVSEMTLMGYGSNGSVREAKYVLSQINATDNED
jgi:hypothetical protein